MYKRQALANDHDGSILDDLGGFQNHPQAANGAGILGHVLGDQQPVAAQGLAQNSNLNANQTGQLLQMAAPLLMGALGQQQQHQGFDPGSLANFLGGQQQQAQQADPGMMDMLNRLLDTNRSGSALDEIMGFIGRLFGGR